VTAAVESRGSSTPWSSYREIAACVRQRLPGRRPELEARAQVDRELEAGLVRDHRRGRFKGGDLRLLREPLKRRARAVVAIGEAAPLVKDALAGAIDVREAETFEGAVKEAFALAKPDGVVLLSPACASFDMFRDYAERGRRFKEEVRKLE
jgi:hypothetical protein